MFFYVWKVEKIGTRLVFISSTFNELNSICIQCWLGRLSTSRLVAARRHLLVRKEGLHQLQGSFARISLLSSLQNFK